MFFQSLLGGFYVEAAFTEKAAGGESVFLNTQTLYVILCVWVCTVFSALIYIISHRTCFSVFLVTQCLLYLITIFVEEGLVFFPFVLFGGLIMCHQEQQVVSTSSLLLYASVYKVVLHETSRVYSLHNYDIPID